MLIAPFQATAAEDHDEFLFAIEVGDLAMKLGHRISNNTIKARLTMLYAAMNRTFAPASIRATPARLESALQYALAAGERTYSCFSQLHRMAYKLCSTVHLSDSLVFAEEAMSDIMEVRCVMSSFTFHEELIKLSLVDAVGTRSQCDLHGQIDLWLPQDHGRPRSECQRGDGARRRRLL